jgi:hypothetical protein
MAGPTQPQVFDDAWDDQRIDAFYQDQKARGARSDFDLIEAGYRGMRPDDFSRYLTSAGHHLMDTNDQGETVWDRIAQHASGAAYLTALPSTVPAD